MIAELPGAVVQLRLILSSRSEEKHKAGIFLQNHKIQTLQVPLSSRVMFTNIKIKKKRGGNAVMLNLNQRPYM